MNISRIKSVLSNSARFLLVAVACTFLIFSNAFPAFANSSAKSDPTEGSARLDNVQRKSEDILKRDPLDLQETQAEANKGLNEIQGSADASSMSRPSNSRKAETPAEKVERALEKATGRD
jgi:hypothetical protein